MEHSQGQGGSSLRKSATIEKAKKLSCLECRRLKLKCDRQFPCSSCVRRGVHSICPNGTLQPSKNAKYILTENEELRIKVSQLMDRICFLEQALMDATKGHSEWQRTQPHPHLNELLPAHGYGQPITGLHRQTGAQEFESLGTDAQENSVEELQHSLGTLIIDEGGQERWLGATATSESYIQDAEAESPDTEASTTFPFSFDPTTRHMTKEMLFERLPPYEEASALVEVYMGHVAWLCQPFDRSSLFRETIRPAYGPDKFLLPNGNLALLFIVLAVGTIMDLTRPPDYSAAKRLHTLAETALVLSGDMLARPTIAIIQALHVIGFYLQMTPGKDDPASGLITHGIATGLAQSIGLHRDPARFGSMSNDEVRTRRRLWWDLVNADSWQSMTLGRPMSIFQRNFDTQFPDDTEETLGYPPYYQHYKVDFNRHCLMPLMEHALSITPPTYTEVLQLDSRLRNWEDPGRPDTGAKGTNLKDSSSLTTLFSGTEICLLYLHRVYCTRALREHPENPLKSRYAPSFVAAYRSSVDSLHRIHKLYAENSALMLRFWVFSAHAISASIMLGAIISQSPGSKLAESALLELEAACHFFENAKSNSRVARSLPTIQILKQKCYFALAQYRAGLWTPPDRNGVPLTDDQDTPGIITDVKIISAKSPRSTTPMSSTPNAVADPNGSGSLQATTLPDTVLHPFLAEYLRSIQQSNLPRQFQTSPFAESTLHQSLPHLTPTHFQPTTNTSSQQLYNESTVRPEQSIAWPSPVQLPEIDLALVSTYIPLPDFPSAHEFTPMEDTMVTQSMNEEWNKFMREL